MASAVDATIPAEGVPALKQDFRDNFAIIKSELETLQATGLLQFGNLVTGPDADLIYSRATHGDFPAFWYKDNPQLTAVRTLTFPIAEGIAGSICLIRVRVECNFRVDVRLEDGDNPGTYVTLPVEPGHSRIIRKNRTEPSWWTDFGFWQNGAQVNHAFVSQADAEAGTEQQARSWSPLRVAQAIAALAPVGGGGEGHVAPGVTTHAGTTPVVMTEASLEVQRFTATFGANVTLDLPATAPTGLGYWIMRDVALANDAFSLTVRLSGAGATVQNVPAGYAARLYRGASAWEVVALAPLALVLSGALNLGGGAGILDAVTNGQVRLKSLTAGAGIQLNPSGTEIQIVSTGTAGEANTGSNVGVDGVGVFDAKVGVDLRFRRIRSTTNRLSVAQGTQQVELTVAEGNLSIAAGQVTGLDPIATSGSADDLADGSTNVAMLATERTKLAGIEEAAEANLAANVGGGNVLFKDKTGSTLNFKTLTAGAGVTLTPGTNTLQIDATGAGGGEVNTGSNVGGGDAGVFAEKNGVDLEFRTISGINGIAVAENGDVIEIDGGGLAGHPVPGSDTHATDADLTLIAASSAEVQDLSAVFTAHRNVELPTTGTFDGLYYVVRRTAALNADAFFARVRLPASTIFVDVPAGFSAKIYRNASTWLVHYISPITGTTVADLIAALAYEPMNY